MNATFAQIIAVIAIVVIGYFVFKFFPLEHKTINLTISALFIVLSVVLSSLSMKVFLFGSMSLKFGFSQMPLMLIGVLLGPSWAFISGIVQDLLDILLNPSGFPFFGFTLNKVIIGLLPALCFSKWNKLNNKQTAYLIYILSVLVYGLTIRGIQSTDSVTIEQQLIELTPAIKMTLIAIITAVFMILVIYVFLLQRNQKKEEKYPVMKWMLSIILVELVVQLTLTPTWLDVMYGIPFVMNQLVRLLKFGFMIILNAFIGQFVLKTMSKLRK